ncbi:NUDIX domain-containing protein [Deinococcus yavapaiensis]|uniref:ADP-ribose pyrophosphatase YjhB (NUDIX family) n=1 Tax=Deinococcus yavapaiensis KR-236 TaxID=694435 RepID=A0A318SCL6_9DEIO|nr:NUDIX domain-containing protein [Deinococcus yavapaiensis]PYE49440.1 ADP-ribose pyrophosphatase YjhB (NUDIX family) [Deinococcus yavapaiensis KR-236]
MYINARALVESEPPHAPALLLQRRDEDGVPSRLETPGGCIEPFEGILDALRREVREETGLHVTKILDDPRPLLVAGDDGTAECLQPYFAYQTLHGPVDSLGYYFRCHASGTLLERGDDSKDLRWVELSELQRLLDEQPTLFSWIDRAALTYYLARREARSNVEVPAR